MDTITIEQRKIFYHTQSSDVSGALRIGEYTLGRYGYYVWGPYNIRTLYSSYYQFDVSSILRKQIVSAALILKRISIENGDPNPIVDVRTSQWQADLDNVSDPGNISGTYPNFGYDNIGRVIRTIGNPILWSTTQASGDIRIVLNIPDASKQQDGLMGFYCVSEMNYGRYGLAEDSTAFVEFTVIDNPPLAPINLLPTTTQNPRGAINISWWHSPANTALPDPQVGSELTIWQSGVTPVVYTLNNTNNEYTLPANTFTAYNPVLYKVRTKSQYNGYGAFSVTQQFPLGTTPPLAPILTFPQQNISINAESGALLEWVYASNYDITPTGFDIRYKFAEDLNWTYIPKQIQLSAMTAPIILQKKVEWQVRAYGELGDVGAWSEIGIFFTIGIPDAPIIVNISNSNRPLISFSAIGLTSWELRINQDGETVYQTGTQSFENIFNHRITSFLPNGNYMAALRINNEYGLRSEWAERPFAINVVSPPGLSLKIIDNPTFNIHLLFNNLSNNTAYIYRSEFETENYLRISKTNNNYFDDFTARPRQQYKYFVRTVDANFNYSDSNIEVGILQFKHTTIAQHDTPENMLMFLGQLDSMPTKDTTFDMEKSLTHFIGRKSPVVQLGELTTKSLSLSFYCPISDYELLEQYTQNPKILILRDWRLGAIYGVINGSISATRALHGCIISFLYTQTDYNEEVDLEQ